MKTEAKQTVEKVKNYVTWVNVTPPYLLKELTAPRFGLPLTLTKLLGFLEQLLVLFVREVYFQLPASFILFLKVHDNLLCSSSSIIPFPVFCSCPFKSLSSAEAPAQLPPSSDVSPLSLDYFLLYYNQDFII